MKALENKHQMKASTPKTAEALFVIVSLGYWGKGKTLKSAAESCSKAGASKRQKCVAYQYNGTPEDLKGVRVNGGGDIEFPQSVESIRLFGLRDGTAKTLGKIIREA